MSFLRHQSDAEVPQSESVFSMSTICLLDAENIYNNEYINEYNNEYNNENRSNVDRILK